ncbi:tetratricopeptide repeat protein [Pacificimonas sp. WHA3]|uniref:Tetratricopeptide repeat protein n=1 Tax=Pacificimonas pallii TaxID=2827236 RepID=A0ABS6SE65_9SPHN|nr:tetratricopeptide repeat protein [Pacificimonas pallii]MBV7256707.1 tetratricopeptide repeat protein [Pacificimonas pallii]
MNKTVFVAALAAAVAGVSTVAWCDTAEPRIAPQSISLTKAGEGLLNARDAEGAIRQFETALAVDPKNVRAYIGMARAHDMLGLPGRAVKFYREGLTIDPANLTALEEQGEALVDRGAVARAEKNLERIRDLCARECAQAERLAAVIASGPPAIESAESVAKAETLPVKN